MSSPHPARVPFLAALSALALAGAASAQVQPLPGLTVPYARDSGQVGNRTGGPAIVASFVVDVPGAPWLRLHLDGTDLSGDPWRGSGAVLLITSLKDGAVQTMDARHLAQWQYRSAYFNGDAVLVECLAEDGPGMSRVVVTGVTIGVPEAVPVSQCGATDDRVLSSDPRMGRAIPIGCTAWMIDDCQRCFLTAGHCTGGSLQTVEFNVPLSDPVTGAHQHPPPSDQYAVDRASVLTNGGQGTGDDWGYFGVFPNSTTGQTPFEAMGQSYAVIGAALPPFSAGQPIRITGYGSDFDTPAHDNVQQTHTGPWVTFSGTLVQYQTDTEGGNSGSPIEHDPTGQALGIHTHGGCTTAGSGQNSGTMLTHPGLQAALADPQGVCAGGIAVVDLPQSLEPGMPATATLAISGTVLPGTARMWWRLDGGSYQQQALTPLGGGAYEATLLAQACADAPEFYFTAEIEGCGPTSNPPGAPFTVHTALVGTEVSILQDDFQTDQGWGVQDGAGLTTGTWERVVPVFNDRGDPPADADGSGMCYVTDNATNADVDGGTTTLTSLPMDLSGGALIRYAYWLNSTSASAFGSEDSLQVEVATDPAGATWTLLRDYRTVEESWRADTIAVGIEVPASATLRIRFSVSDLSPADVVEGGLDAVEVFRLECAGSMTPFCAGDGTSAACPCANTGLAGRGCDNAQHTGGVQLAASGDPLANSVVLQGTHFPPRTSPAVVAIRSLGAQSPPVAFGDGLRCLSTAGLVRITSGLAGLGSIALPISHGAGAGTFHYQLWYRSNPAGYCMPEAFNLSNGLTIVWP